ncbi:PPOX class probable FMN-dependent enzyme [Constrictibacter sp. MBR-5]|jgi:PPOX class probable FMN-dependent enzyme|uniref:pyridoxamine 5'-phosphate oxidase family protein n=1 Tax=Constrictibacter sp. MBR-5 TaxID=3156467 RepID=UPI0033923CB7
MSGTRIDTAAALEALYGEPDERSLVKEVDRLTAPYRAFVETAPFFALATVGPGGLDCSPRGDAPGFVRVVDDRTLVVPDRRGNNRIDSLRNIVADPRVGLLFLIPGVGETLRINGTAELDADPDLAKSFAVDGKLPRLCIRITIDTVYFQCSRALVRSSLWDSAARVERAAVPTAGAMLKACRDSFDADAYDAALPERVEASLY